MGVDLGNLYLVLFSLFSHAYITCLSLSFYAIPVKENILFGIISEAHL